MGEKGVETVTVSRLSYVFFFHCMGLVATYLNSANIYIVLKNTNDASVANGKYGVYGVLPFKINKSINIFKI